MDVIAILTGLKGKALDLQNIELLKHAYELQDQNVKQFKENNELLRATVGDAQARIKSLEDENAELRSQVESLASRLLELAEVTPDEYSASADNDILAILKSWFRERSRVENCSVIRFADIDRELKLPPGSTKKHIVNVAQPLQFVVEHQATARRRHRTSRDDRGSHIRPVLFW